MIDMHTHVLPEIDDGSKSVEESIAMLIAAKEQGIKTVVATSHYYGKQRSPEKYKELRQETFEKIRPYIPDGMTVKLGAEVRFSEENSLSHEQICSLAIEGTKYVLIEFDFLRPFTEKLFRRLAEFIYDVEYIPIIAHVERYPSVLKNPKLLTKFIEMGCLLQVNAEAFYRKQTKSLATLMLKRGFVHCIGTDMHDEKERTANYDKMLLEIEKAGLKADFEETQKWSSKILRGEKIRVYSKPTIKRFLNKYF